MATKVGMMTYFDAATGKPVPVTVVSFREGGNHVTQVKTTATDGYDAVQVGYHGVREDKLTRPELGHLGKAGAPPLRRLQEFRLQSVDAFAPGQPLDFAELFKKGDLVDVSGNSIGKGFQGVREYVEAAREMARQQDGGPARWFSPLECGGAGAGGRVPGAPTLLYLPGLVEYVERTVKSESSRAPDRQVYLVGESVGACIALAVAARNPDINLVLILVNPGTSFQKSQLQSLSAFLDLVPEPFHLSTPQFLNFLTGNGNFMKMPSIAGRGLPLEEAGQALSEITTSVLPSLMEGEFDLATTIRGAGYYRRSRQTDFVSDKKMPGRMGGTKNKIRKLKIVKIDDDLRVLMIKGAVPGKPGNLLRIAPAKIVGNNIPKN